MLSKQNIQSEISGQECPRSVISAERSNFLDRSQPISKHKHNLPHWQQEDKWYFVTWRLGDSLPADLFRKLEREKDVWLQQHPILWDLETEDEYHELFSHRVDEWLDQGRGSCVLRDQSIGQLAADVMRFDQQKRVELDCFVVMPNHVHALFRLFPDHLLEKILKSWKGISSRRIHKALGQSGTLLAGGLLGSDDPQ